MVRGSAHIGCCVAATAIILAGLIDDPALAVDGVVEINQASALVGGLTAGDTIGFPVSITASGAYRLTGNLTVAGSDTAAIEVSASNVSIDLNGFSIQGPATCSGIPPTCSSGTGDGIRATSGARDLRLQNGIITGMPGDGIDVFSAHVEGIQAYENGEDGIFTGPDSTITRCVAMRNGSHGIDGGGVITDNVVSSNGGRGLNIFPDSGFGNNVIVDNAGGTTSAALEIRANLCDANTICP